MSSEYKGTILENLTRSALRTDPYPHMVLEDALDPDLFAALLAERPACPLRNAARANTRYPISAHLLTSLDFYPPVWADFAARHTRPDILWGIRDLFGDHWPETLPEPPKDPAVYGLIDRDRFESRPDLQVLCDSRLEIITPSGDQAGGSHRRAHLDTPNRLFSALLYFRGADDDSTGGGLELFEWASEDRARDIAAFEVPPETVRRKVTVPYRANTLVIYANSPLALHGSEPRGATAHDRAYVFITAEVEKDLFPSRRREDGSWYVPGPVGTAA